MFVKDRAAPVGSPGSQVKDTRSFALMSSEGALAQGLQSMNSVLGIALKVTYQTIVLEARVQTTDKRTDLEKYFPGNSITSSIK